MKYLTKIEFANRLKACKQAHKIFKNLTDNNITTSFEIYCELLATEAFDVMINHGPRRPTFLDRFHRPRCPECGEELGLRSICMPQGRRNLYGYKSCWECFGPTCTYERFSKHSVAWQLKQLKRKGES